jgi:cytochrome c553
VRGYGLAINPSPLTPTLSPPGRGSAPSPWRGRASIAKKRVPASRGVGLLVVLAVLLFVAPTLAEAGDAAAGRRKAVACQACHGLDGLSKLPEAPHLAGQPERYLVKSLDEYRSGARSNELMSIAAKTLSDQDVADLAAYYAAIEISVTPPK